MANPFYFVVSDTDKQDRPIDVEDFINRCNEITALIPQPPVREPDNNMRFVEKAFTLFKDCGLINKENVEALNDPNWCQNKFNTKMNPLGGVLRREDLTMWDNNNLRYYCPREELKLSSDIETADRRQWSGASKLAVICGGVTYYISNDWFSDDKPRPTKSKFTRNLIIEAIIACNMLPSELPQESVVIEDTSEKPEPVAADSPTISEETSKPDDLKAVLASLEELHKKFDSVNKQINNINDNLNMIANKLNDKTETLSEDLTQKIEDVNKEVKALYELWK